MSIREHVKNYLTFLTDAFEGLALFTSTNIYVLKQDKAKNG